MRKIVCFFILLLLLTPFVSSGQNSVFNNAKWITAFENQNETNTWLTFRKEVELDEIPQSAIAKIAVDSKYWLWINGEMVVFEGALKRGPTPQDTYYDEVEIAPFLKEGKNTLAILLWYFGKDGFAHNSSGEAGLLFECETDNFSIASDLTWTARVHPAYLQSGPPYPNFRLSESNIYFDARLDLGNWYDPDYEYSSAGFGEVREIGNPGDAPWNKLIKRPIPLWKDFGMKEYVDQIRKSGDEMDTIVCTLPYNAQFTPYFEVATEKGEKIEMKTDAYMGGGPPNVRGIYITKEGSQSYENLGWLSGNKMYYIVPKNVRLNNLKFRETGYNTEFTGHFESDNPFMNLLWEKARRTLYVTMRDTYMDCPDRERSQWIGDVVNESGEAFYALDTNSYALHRKALYELVNWQRKDSTLYAPVPSGNWDRELPSQVLAMVGYYGFWNYYQYTADKRPLKDLYEGVKKYLGVWKLNEKGTVIFREGGWTWGDWGTNVDKALLENMWYYLALKGMSKIAGVLGLEEDTKSYTESMANLKTAINKELWTEAGYRGEGYKDSIDDRGQALAVVSGVADRDKYEKLFQIFKEEEHASPYMEKYVLEALFRMDEPEYALYRMEKRFGPMVNDSNYNTLFEGWKVGQQSFGGGTFNHAWSGGGLTLLSQYVCGVSPLEPGYEVFKVRPQMGTIKEAKAKITTVKGDIEVALKKERNQLILNLTVPESTKCRLELPDAYKKIFKDGKKIETQRVDGRKVVTIPAGTYSFKAQ